MIRVKHFHPTHAEVEPGINVFIEGVSDVDGFKTLIQRGAQTWADAPAGIKRLADLVTNEMEMQDYASMSGEKK